VRGSEKPELLIVDDDSDFRSTVVQKFQRRGYAVREARSGDEALRLAQDRQFNVAIVDMVMPGMSGQELLEKLKEVDPDCEVIILTGQGTIESAVTAIKSGAYDYVTKPCALAELELLVEKAHERHGMRQEITQLREVIRRGQPDDTIVGQSPAMRELFRLIERAGPTEQPILIQGESGTGKELVARALHRASQRANKHLVVINCAALPETLLESELFGHEKGAFTGAINTKSGLFELADRGTLFIDEIGEMSGNLQAKLLRVLEDGSLRRVGSLKERRVNVRLLAATNRNMAEEVRTGRFREDLYYRINVMSLQLPPLRQRAGDLPLLVERFLGPGWTIEADALATMERFPWPGNVRQLQNAIQRAKIMADDGVIRTIDLPPEILSPTTASAPSPVASAREVTAHIQPTHVLEALRTYRGNKARAANALGINRRSMYRLLEKFGIQSPDSADEPAGEPSEAAPE
jgi:DNA-binding NtrC family response regulator